MTGIPPDSMENQPNAVFKSFLKYRSLAQTLDRLDENTRQAIIELAEKLRG